MRAIRSAGTSVGDSVVAGAVAEGAEAGAAPRVRPGRAQGQTLSGSQARIAHAYRTARTSRRLVFPCAPGGASQLWVPWQPVVPDWPLPPARRSIPGRLEPWWQLPVVGPVPAAPRSQ